ncbi:hypothetical protein BGZ94_001553, partial [Podila epigama]
PNSGPGFIGNHQQGEFHILPIDESKKNLPPPPSKHTSISTGHPQGPNLSSEHHVGPALMPGAFMNSMGTNATTFEREHHSKVKKE